eukprot:764587-Hanusia_phi.AAC.3
MMHIPYYRETSGGRCRTESGKQIPARVPTASLHCEENGDRTRGQPRPGTVRSLPVAAKDEFLYAQFSTSGRLGAAARSVSSPGLPGSIPILIRV